MPVNPISRAWFAWTNAKIQRSRQNWIWAYHLPLVISYSPFIPQGFFTPLSLPSILQWRLPYILNLQLPLFAFRSLLPRLTPTLTLSSGSTHTERRPQNKYFLQRKRPLFYHQIGNTIFFIFFTNQLNLMFCVDKINNKHLAFLSDLKSCQFALRIVIFNICIGCQFEDLQIILPKIIPMSHRNN